MNQEVSPHATPPKCPPAEEFCLRIPLYEVVSYDDDNEDGFYSLEHFKGTLDFYCHGCGQHSVFTVQEKEYRHNIRVRNYVFGLTFKCSRESSHVAIFIFHAHAGILQKIGQIPSLADLALPDLRKYRPVLGNDRQKELARAIGLTAHGVGVGAFVYLRRIFESLIEQAHDKARSDAGWDEDEYLRSRMEEKIGHLKEHLPEFLVENRSLYGILSVGVHTLNEDECLAAFPAVRLAIELILDDLLEEYERKKKLKSAANSIAALKKSNGRTSV